MSTPVESLESSPESSPESSQRPASTYAGNPLSHQYSNTSSEPSAQSAGQEALPNAAVPSHKYGVLQELITTPVESSCAFTLSEITQNNEKRNNVTFFIIKKFS